MLPSDKKSGQELKQSEQPLMYIDLGSGGHNRGKLKQQYFFANVLPMRLDQDVEERKPEGF